MAVSHLPHFTLNPFQHSASVTMPATQPGLLTDEHLRKLHGINDSYIRAASTYQLLKELQAFPADTFSSEFMMKKIMEEAREVRVELRNHDKEKLEAETADLITCVYWFIKENGYNQVTPLVTQATDRYLNRIKRVQELNGNQPIRGLEEPEFRQLWEKAKKIEKQQKQASQQNMPPHHQLNLSA